MKAHTHIPGVRNPDVNSKTRCSLTIANVILAIAITTLGSGCVAIRSQYVEAKFRDATYSSLTTPKAPVPVTINVAFQTNGKPNDRVNYLLRSEVLKVLNTSRVMCQAPAGNSGRVGTLNITVNNYGNTAGAATAGAFSGLTMGAVGTEVVDNYTMTATYTPATGAPVTKTYHHALHSMEGLVHTQASGLVEVPNGTPAFDVIMQDMMLNFLRDLQRERRL